eukprot:3738982-Rhodomonas_salina.1
MAMGAMWGTGKGLACASFGATASAVIAALTSRSPSFLQTETETETDRQTDRHRQDAQSKTRNGRDRREEATGSRG